jgi:hypothetical protein
VDRWAILLEVRSNSESEQDDVVTLIMLTNWWYLHIMQKCMSRLAPSNPEFFFFRLHIFYDFLVVSLFYSRHDFTL